MVLDAHSLEAIEQEVRNCFLYEDAPEYLSALERDLQLLNQNDTGIDREAIYQSLMRTTHSLKGGAGIAQLTHLSSLAHKLEDLSIAVQQGKVADLEIANTLFTYSFDWIDRLIGAAIRGGTAEEAKVAASASIFQELDLVLQEIAQQNSSTAEATLDISAPNFAFLKAALEVDLEDCLQRVETILADGATSVVTETLAQFIEECTLLGETLGQNWLSEIVKPLCSLLDGSVTSEIEPVVRETISTIRQRRSIALQPSSPKSPEQSAPKPQPNPPTSSSLAIPELKLRMPVSRLNRIDNNLGELFINQERLTLFQNQLSQVNTALKKRVEQFRPINEGIQTVYDRLATTGSTQTSSNSEFDSLEFDRYTDLHSSLQELQELMVRVQESRADIDLIAWEFQASLDDLRRQLNDLRKDVTESRFVPFRNLSERLAIPLPSLNQQYKKAVELHIEGEYTPIDQLILEQLETPLTHLFRNAFDHGIETVAERNALGKPATAQIKISASIEGNRVTIAISDDGRGIDLEKVYQKARQSGLTEASFAALTKKQILDFLFMAGFSTAKAVTELSGRGVGLDIVRLQVERLGGSIEIETKLGQGTQFMLRIPLSLSILPLLICRSHQHTLAFPSNEVIEAIEVQYYDRTDCVIWQDRSIPIYPLGQILPYNQSIAINLTPEVLSSPERFATALIVRVGKEFVALEIDSLLTEKELVVKPFDNTIPVPPYLLGCTVLGTGEVIPVLNSNRFGELLQQSPAPAIPITPSAKTCILIVDDSIAVRRMLDRCLSQSGYQVIQCKDGKEALAVLEQGDHQFNLVISDIEMPRLDGFGLLREIRAHQEWQNLPVAMLTSRDNEVHRTKASNLGAVAYFTKPFQPQKILNRVAELI
jgi:chemotaxis protein histidine kinase CheA/CheY-like chemotaxis protein